MNIVIIGAGAMGSLFGALLSRRQALLDCLQLIGPDTTILTLQNGLGNIEAIRAIAGSGKVVAGTTSYGCCCRRRVRLR